MNSGEDLRFKASFTGEGQARLKVRVKEKLKELMGDYSDDTLAEYATVLIRNGRSRAEAATELHVFLGDDNDAFVSWLWDHLSSNLHLYFQSTKAVSSKDGVKSTLGAADSVRTLKSSLQTNNEPEAETQKATRTHQRREWGGMVHEKAQAVQPLRSVVASVSYADEKDSHGSQVEDKRFHKPYSSVKRTRSPDRHSQRKRGREEDERSTKRPFHPVIEAPHRLLQFAVRDAVRPVQPKTSRSESGSKRLCSVVSKMASDLTIDDTHIRLRRANMDLGVPGAVRAPRPAAEAAEDVLKDNFSRSVFTRQGMMPTVNYSESSLHREQDPDQEEYEDMDIARAENQAKFHRRNEYSGCDAYMYDRKIQEAAGSAPNSDEYDNNSVIRSNGVPRRGTLPSGEGKESLVVGYARGAAELSSRRPITLRPHADSGPRPSENILNASANTTARHDTRDAATFVPQVPVEQKISDARKPNATISHVNDPIMTDKAKDSIHLSSMVEAQKASSVVGSGSAGQPEDVNNSRTIFVTNVHFAASKDALSRHFNKFGAILKTIIVTDGVTGQRTGSAYIEFSHKESAEQALALNGTSFMSRILKVVRRSSIEVPQQPVWPRPRGSPYASRLIRTAYPRPTFPGAARWRLPLRGGTRNLQWKREAVDATDDGKSIQATPAAPGNQLVTPITRSFTYTRTESKPNGGAMV